MKIRTEHDRDILREGGRRLGSILHATAQKAQPGTTLRELDAYTAERIAEGGDTPSFKGYGEPPFPGVACFSVNDVVVHGLPSDYALKSGDVLTIDCGIWHEGLCTDANVTVGIGQVSEEVRTLIWAVEEALEAQIAVAVAGNTIGDIGHAAETIAKKYGFGFPKELGGHGVGLSVHESPFVFNYGKPGKGQKLEEGMVLALEPILTTGKGAVYLDDDQWSYRTKDNSVAAQAEHTVIVGKDAAEVLTVRPA